MPSGSTPVKYLPGQDVFAECIEAFRVILFVVNEVKFFDALVNLDRGLQGHFFLGAGIVRVFLCTADFVRSATKKIVKFLEEKE